MSRFIKPSYNCDNAYVQFRFESSLRKYQSKPSKKIKCDGIASNMCIHHPLRKAGTSSPRSNQCGLHFSKGKVTHGCEKTVEKQSVSGLSESHMVSSNKSIKISKRRAFQERSCNSNELEKKIYASLVNNQKGQNKHQHSSQKDQLFLNDFEPQIDMDLEEAEEGDADFGQIQINHNLGLKIQLKEGQVLSKRSREDNELNRQVKQFEQKQQENLSKVQQSQQNHQQVHITQQVEKIKHNGKLCQNQKEIKAIPKGQQFSQKVDLKPQINSQAYNVITSTTAELKDAVIDRQMTTSLIQTKPQQNNPYIFEQSNEFIRERCEEDSITSKVIYQKQMDEPLTQKCLAFQGGRIYIDSSGQKFYISVRVFNKLTKNCSHLDDLLTTLISQRPYLQSKRSQLKEELESYLRNSA